MSETNKPEEELNGLSPEGIAAMSDEEFERFAHWLTWGDPPPGCSYKKWRKGHMFSKGPKDSA